MTHSLGSNRACLINLRATLPRDDRAMASAGVFVLGLRRARVRDRLDAPTDASPRTRPGRSSGRLYGANTAGAAVGSLAAGFFLIPILGLTGTTLTGIAAGAVSIALALSIVPSDLTEAGSEDAPAKPHLKRSAAPCVSIRGTSLPTSTSRNWKWPPASETPATDPFAEALSLDPNSAPAREGLAQARSARGAGSRSAINAP